MYASSSRAKPAAALSTSHAMSTILGQKEMAAMTFALRLKGILSFAADATTCVAWLTLVTSTAPILAISFLPVAVAAQLVKSSFGFLTDDFAASALAEEAAAAAPRPRDDDDDADDDANEDEDEDEDAEAAADTGAFFFGPFAVFAGDRLDLFLVLRLRRAALFLLRRRSFRAATLRRCRNSSSSSSSSRKRPWTAALVERPAERCADR